MPVRAPGVNARYVVRITAADVGARVSVRSHIPAAEGQPTSTDTLGVLRSWSDGALEIERSDGSRISLREADLLAARRIPAAPQRRLRPAP